MLLRIVEAVEKAFEEKNEGKKLASFQKSKAQEMERAMGNFITAIRHFDELGRDVDLTGIKLEIKKELERELR